MKLRRGQLDWQRFLAFGLALCLLVIALLHPIAPHAPVLAALVLLPVALFGLVVVPRSLWPAAGPDLIRPLPVRARASLLQRPPPHSLR